MLKSVDDLIMIKLIFVGNIYWGMRKMITILFKE